MKGYRIHAGAQRNGTVEQEQNENAKISAIDDQVKKKPIDRSDISDYRPCISILSQSMNNPNSIVTARSVKKNVAEGGHLRNLLLGSVNESIRGVPKIPNSVITTLVDNSEEYIAVYTDPVNGIGRTVHPSSSGPGRELTAILPVQERPRIIEVRSLTSGIRVMIRNDQMTAPVPQHRPSSFMETSKTASSLGSSAGIRVTTIGSRSGTSGFVQQHDITAEKRMQESAATTPIVSPQVWDHVGMVRNPERIPPIVTTALTAPLRPSNIIRSTAPIKRMAPIGFTSSSSSDKFMAATPNRPMATEETFLRPEYLDIRRHIPPPPVLERESPFKIELPKKRSAIPLEISEARRRVPPLPKVPRTTKLPPQASPPPIDSPPAIQCPPPSTFRPQLQPAATPKPTPPLVRPPSALRQALQSLAEAQPSASSSPTPPHPEVWQKIMAPLPKQPVEYRDSSTSPIKVSPCAGILYSEESSGMDFPSGLTMQDIHNFHLFKRHFPVACSSLCEEISANRMKYESAKIFCLNTGIEPAIFECLAKDVYESSKAIAEDEHDEDEIDEMTDRTETAGQKRVRSFSHEDELLLTLMKLKTNFSTPIMAYLFGRETEAVVDTLKRWIPFLASWLKPLIAWPSSKAHYNKGIPDKVRKEFGDGAFAVLDVMEVKLAFDDLTEETTSVKFAVVFDWNGSILYRSRLFDGPKMESAAVIQACGQHLGFEPGSDPDLMVPDKYIVTRRSYRANERCLDFQRANHVYLGLIARLRRFKILNDGKFPVGFIPCVDDIVTICCALVSLAATPNKSGPKSKVLVHH